MMEMGGQHSLRGGEVQEARGVTFCRIGSNTLSRSRMAGINLTRSLDGSLIICLVLRRILHISATE